MNEPRHATVIGGSIAGMCALRVLCDVFERVSVVARVAWTRFRQMLAPPPINQDKTPDYPPAPSGGAST